MTDLMEALDRLAANVTALNQPGLTRAARHVHSHGAARDAATVAAETGSLLLVETDADGLISVAFTA